MGKRRLHKPQLPSQTRLSVQDVRSTDTPAGISMEDEEMRRLKFDSDLKDDRLDALEAALGAKEPEKPAVIPGDGGEGGTGNTIQNITQITNNYVTGANIKMLSGTVWVNRRPQLPPVGGYPDSERYKYENREYDPQHGKYGYYVYAIIRHFWDLPDPNNYILELVDKHEIFRDPDYQQNYILQSEGFDTNTVILHGVYKPTDGILQYNERGELMTDLLFDFVLIGKPTADEYSNASPGWILTGPVGTLWSIDVDPDGALIIDMVFDVEETPMYLTSPDGTVWEVTVTADINGYALTTTVVTGIAGATYVYIRSTDDTLWLLSIDDTGALITQ